LRGALAGGLAVGTVQALAGYAFGAGSYDLAPLVVLLAALALRAPAAGLRAGTVRTSSAARTTAGR
jgi:hypothetical protein